MKRICSAALLALGLIAAPTPVALAQTEQETLKQYVSDLQKKPADTALREKIIKHVQTMKATPQIPEEVDELVGQAKYAFKYAKTQGDYLDAVEAYKRIVNITPWVGDYYYNLGLAQERSGQPHDAINSFKLYLLSSPDEKDAKEARERIGGLKYVIEKAAKESSLAVIAENKQDSPEEWLRKIDGRRYTFSGGDTLYTIDVRGRVLVRGWIGDSNYSGTRGYHETDRIEIEGRETTVPVTGGVSIQGARIVEWKFIISEDGNQITALRRQSNGQVDDYIYLWQR